MAAAANNIGSFYEATKPTLWVSLWSSRFPSIEPLSKKPLNKQFISAKNRFVQELAIASISDFKSEFSILDSKVSHDEIER
jgi:hypothetical protein